MTHVLIVFLCKITIDFIKLIPLWNVYPSFVIICHCIKRISFGSLDIRLRCFSLLLNSQIFPRRSRVGSILINSCLFCFANSFILKEPAKWGYWQHSIFALVNYGFFCLKMIKKKGKKERESKKNYWNKNLYIYKV